MAPQSADSSLGPVTAELGTGRTRMRRPRGTADARITRTARNYCSDGTSTAHRAQAPLCTRLPSRKSVRNRLAAGGKRFRTLGPPRINDAFKTALFALRYFPLRGRATRFAKEIGAANPPPAYLTWPTPMMCVVSSRREQDRGAVAFRIGGRRGRARGQSGYRQ